jgi:hypothetical protein
MPYVASGYVGARDSHGRIIRSEAAKREFMLDPVRFFEAYAACSRPSSLLNGVGSSPIPASASAGFTSRRVKQRFASLPPA